MEALDPPSESEFCTYLKTAKAPREQGLCCYVIGVIRFYISYIARTLVNLYAKADFALTVACYFLNGPANVGIFFGAGFALFLLALVIADLVNE